MEKRTQARQRTLAEIKGCGLCALAYSCKASAYREDNDKPCPEESED